MSPYDTTAPAPAPASPGTAAPPATAGELRARVWESVMAFDESAAIGAVVRALEEGMGAEDLLLDVIASVQRRVGREWAADRITVAQEHAATAINDRAVTALTLHPSAQTAPTRGRVAVACVDGEWHALPARLLAEVLRLRGWRVDYLGAQVSAPHLVAHLHRTGPDLVALSGSLATRLPAAHAAITACQAVGTPVLVGGAAFGPGGRYARLLGADGWAPDARAAADALARGPLPRVRPGHHAIDDLPHLKDQEYTLVTRSRPQLVGSVFGQLADACPAMRAYSEVQRERTAEDLSHIVEFLAAALYTGDEDLFCGFLEWTAGVLDARGVPSASLRPALELLGRELQDFPRATAILRAGAARLTRTPLSPAGTAE
ncbi:B12-binding domain-containing protein [Streptomyces sp. NPDC059525]|uniref:cobalamin B12-binding domain-containing protein n=1 Tax=Streptomyces sp. NPDC059525 TaxID=3346857 RepID=UPI0036A36E0E